ncbi:DUF397 domain-containing protein [Streptomyces sp. NPDC056683]|uniref:DUF397 domain-containing protein n=1 Tax=Streptomyces sp. NPDC056683 TaxID=3345910 RepID=UPI0036B5F827
MQAGTGHLLSASFKPSCGARSPRRGGGYSSFDAGDVLSHSVLVPDASCRAPTTVWGARLEWREGAALRCGESTFTWRKSRYSTEAGTCCEIAVTDARVLVRDSKLPSGGILSFTPQAWRAAVRHVRAEGRPEPGGR